MGQQASPAAPGATPVAGATPAPAAPEGANGGATPPAAAPAPATPEDALGDTGKEILRQARREASEASKRAADAEKALQEIRDGQATDAEKSIAAAKREATAEADARWSEWARDTLIEGALRGAGITSDRLLALAKGAPELQALKVGADRRIEGLGEAVETMKKDADYATLFGAKAAPVPAGGSWGGAEGGGNQSPASPGLDRMRRAYESDSKG